jgi:hypothetical protein
MYEITNAHPLTLIVIIGAFLVTPIYAMATYVFSGASKKKGLRVGAGFLVFGTLMFWVCIADFLSAFFFGFGSSETPIQLFFPEVPNNVIVFPTGLIPLFFVPYAIFFHTLSWLSYRKFDKA